MIDGLKDSSLDGLKDNSLEGLNDSSVESTNESSNDEQNKLKPSVNTFRSKMKSVILELVLYAILFVVCIFIIPKYIVQRTIVSGPSMEDTLEDGEQLIIDKLTYHIGDPKRFDIVVFYPYGKDVNEYYVKRVIGLPGETVQIIGSSIYINGEVLEESYGKDPITYSGIAENQLILGQDEFFVLGDNREISLDSRYEEVGILKRDVLAGKALLRIWPLTKVGSVK